MQVRVSRKGDTVQSEAEKNNLSERGAAEIDLVPTTWLRSVSERSSIERDPNKRATKGAPDKDALVEPGRRQLRQIETAIFKDGTSECPRRMSARVKSTVDQELRCPSCHVPSAEFRRSARMNVQSRTREFHSRQPEQAALSKRQFTTSDPRNRQPRSWDPARSRSVNRRSRKLHIPAKEAVIPRRSTLPSCSANPRPLRGRPSRSRDAIPSVSSSPPGQRQRSTSSDITRLASTGRTIPQSRHARSWRDHDGRLRPSRDQCQQHTGDDHRESEVDETPDAR